MFRKLIVLVSIILAILTIVNMTRNSPLCTRSSAERAYVMRVIDGDTIDVLIGQQLERVRYIGIDTPERGEPYSRLATNANADLVANQAITMYKDNTDRDKYNRLLRYVFVEDVFVNQELISQGYAQTLRIPPNTACHGLFLSTQVQARNNNYGLWSWDTSSPAGN